uniref:Mucin-1 n=1 Tax=Neovison vison TaxID=452646 RepID=A0A8C7EUL5_NEOVI
MTPGFQAPLFLLLLASLGTSPTQVPPGHGAITAASTTPRGPEPPAPSNHSTSPQSLSISVFSLSFSIENRHFNSSLEDPGSSYYQELQRNISELFWQIYKKEGFLGLFNIKFRYRSGAGSVVVESTLAFRKGATDARSVQTQLEENKKEFAAYHLFISNVRDVSPLSSGQSGSGVPGWGIALLVLVCVLVALAIICVIALTVCQCRRKNCGQLDIFPARDAYHPMSEYPTYHTHGRYMPPGSRRSPYEEPVRSRSAASSRGSPGTLRTALWSLLMASRSRLVPQRPSRKKCRTAVGWG